MRHPKGASSVITVRTRIKTECHGVFGLTNGYFELAEAGAAVRLLGDRRSSFACRHFAQQRSESTSSNVVTCPQALHAHGRLGADGRLAMEVGV